MMLFLKTPKNAFILMILSWKFSLFMSWGKCICSSQRTVIYFIKFNPSPTLTDPHIMLILVMGGTIINFGTHIEIGHTSCMENGLQAD